tara:strand:+ start:181 stop:516 length:336 start_codon:yes stop_codon:yes gene_type:complete
VEAVMATAVGLEEQPEASIVIEERAVVPVFGSRKLLAVFSAYQLITTAAPLAWPGTLSDVLFDDDETEVPDVSDCALPPFTVYVTTKFDATLELELFNVTSISRFDPSQLP